MSTDVSTRSRETDGKFAAELRTQASEFQDDHMANNGSFCFPPRHTTAAEMIEYFENAPVPEQVLSNAQFAYADFRKQQVKQQADEWAAHWQTTEDFRQFQLDANKQHIGKSGFQRHANKRISEEERKFEEAFPMAMPLLEVETIVRCAQIYSRSGSLPQEEIEKVDAHIVTLTNGVQPTVKQMADRYQASRWIRDATTTSDLQVARTSQRSAEMIVEALRKLNLD